MELTPVKNVSTCSRNPFKSLSTSWAPRRGDGPSMFSEDLNNPLIKPILPETRPNGEIKQVNSFEGSLRKYLIFVKLKINSLLLKPADLSL